MARRLPPLNALKAFDSAARHLSFTKAAAELYVTQAAVSHQIKSLEEWLGVPLFRRGTRSLLLTDAGQAYRPKIRNALDMIEEATGSIHVGEKSGKLTVTVLQSFASSWLVPRLGSFQQAHPEIDVRVSATDDLVDFNSEDIDCGIRYGVGDYKGLHSELVMSEVIFPVCSPRLLEGEHPLKAPADLVHHTLLHDVMRETWSSWLDAAGVDGVNPNRGPTFSHSYMVFQAAIQGQGVALGRSILVQDALAAGRLVKPFDMSLTAVDAYYFVCPLRTAERPKVKAFRDWLMKEAAQETPA
ncbi:MAG: transcriptional regulator GcvA [Alphaproteobacteria bacterium]|nr:transcriptional regulator GcvA [Alphaproteobacteria bacterium]